VAVSDNAPSNGHGGVPNSRYVRSVANPHFFDEDFSHTLGYVNEHFGNPRRPDDGTSLDNPDAPGYMGDPTAWAGNTPRPFSWLTWNNRPFISHLEMLMAPTASSSRLLFNYRMAGAAGAWDPFQDPTLAGDPFRRPLGHLLNFFHSNEASASPPTDPPPAHFYRLLDFVHVPSRFVGTHDQLNPAWAVGGPHGHHPPFNWVSRYREPGRINLNTVFDTNVYAGLMNGFPYPVGWNEFFVGRRGYLSVGGLLALDPRYPTRFVNPYRSFTGLEAVPITALNAAITGPGVDMGVNPTLLRVDLNTPPTRPFFAYDNGFSAADEPNRNPYFRYQGIQRLGNLTTTRSNVYAVWITVGYFEVEPVPGANVDRKVYLEGYTLGRELGGDTGEVKRHRAFYIIDRSIPVAFQRGKDLNAEKTIVLKRFIE
jgi:hypothetical protein